MSNLPFGVTRKNEDVANGDAELCEHGFLIDDYCDECAADRANYEYDMRKDRNG